MESRATLPSMGRPALGVFLVGAIWFGSYFVARLILDAWAPPPHWDIAVASIPVVAFYWFVWAMQRYLRTADELQRRIHLEALALAFPTVMLVLMMLGLLDGPAGGALGVPLRDLWFALPPLYGVCFLVASQRYR